MTVSTSYRLSKEARILLAAMSQIDGISKTAELELAIRERAAARGININNVLESAGKNKDKK